MRILQVINSLATGGAEKLLLDTVPKYIALGVTMDVLVLNASPQPFLTALEKNKSIHVFNFGNGTVYNPFHAFRLISFIRRYDLLHVHLFPSLYWVAIAKLMTFSRTPLLFTEHNTSNRRRNNPIFKILDRIIYKRYRKIITISLEVDSAVKRHLGYNPKRFEFIQNGVPINEIADATSASHQEFSIPRKKKVLIQVSSFTQQKDQQTLIKAMVHLDNAILLLVGEGTLLEGCRTLAAQLNLEDRVRFLGVRMDVPALLKMADVIVLSTHFEGLSLSSIEALASGKPLVASNAPGLAPIVKDAGMLFAIGDEKELAEIVTTLFNSESLYLEVVNKCLARAQQFSIEKMIEKHMDLYKQILQ